MGEVTRILSAIDQGDPHAAEQFLPVVYEELHKLAWPPGDARLRAKQQVGIIRANARRANFMAHENMKPPTFPQMNQTCPIRFEIRPGPWHLFV